MKVGIYNRWLATLGGGEKYSLAVAEFLARRHSVEMISHRPISKDMAAERLNLDLSAVNFRFVPDRPTIELAPISADYDFFINASFLDMFSSLAPHSALLVYFPIPLNVERTKSLYRIGGLFLKKLLLVPTFYGVLDNQPIDHSQLRHVGPRVKIALPNSTSSYKVRFDITSLDSNVRKVTVALNGQPLTTIDLATCENSVLFETLIPTSQRSSVTELSLQAQSDTRLLETPQAKLAIGRFEIRHPRYQLYQLLFERWLKDWGIRLHRTPNRSSPILDCVDTYETIWAISEFSHKWINKYWNRPSAIIYPPVDVENFRPEKKANQILSVGRFFEGSHNKKHDVMIKAFKQMVDEGLSGWHLHLAGGVARGQLHEEYLMRLRKSASGYPITIHTDMRHEALIKLYSESAIYWHTSGFGENENNEPIKFEHFGITTVEAMASGCVPVVIGKGGQPEIVNHGQNGFLWQTLDELKMLTRRLVNDSALREKLASAAITDSRRYDSKHFAARLQEQLDRMGIP